MRQGRKGRVFDPAERARLKPSPFSDPRNADQKRGNAVIRGGSKEGNLSLRLRLRSGLRQGGSACGAAVYGRVGNPALPELGVDRGD